MIIVPVALDIQTYTKTYTLFMDNGERGWAPADGLRA
jgi:hypothetical protein